MVVVRNGSAMGKWLGGSNVVKFKREMGNHTNQYFSLERKPCLVLVMLW